MTEHKKTKEEIISSDLLFSAFLALEQSNHLINSLLDDYFDKYNPDDKDDFYRIIYGFEQARAFAEVIAMVNFQTLKLLTDAGLARF